MKRRTTIFDIKRDLGYLKQVENDEENAAASNEHKYFKTIDPTKFQTFAQFIQSSTELNELIKSNLNSEGAVDFDGHFALIGLHSCGNLSNSIVNLYLSGKLNNVKSQVGNNNRLLCNVACCYNLLNEKYSCDVESYIDVKKTNVKIGDQSKFPMSAHLNDIKYAINFNARSLACHSLDRCISSLEDYREVTSSFFSLN